MQATTTIGLDIAKSVFQVHGALRVTHQRKRWPEKRERKVRWYPPV
jgi:hypothetical protein